MIDKLEEKIDYLVTVNGKEVKKVMRQPNNEEIIQKINEIIDYINAEEIWNGNDRPRTIRKDRKSQ